MNKGMRVVFEGPGFSGKSTVMKLVAEELRKRGLPVVITNEPGGCEGNREIREMIFKKKAAGELSPEREVALFYLDRRINMETTVLPALEKGVIVLQDRDFMSTFLYQEMAGLPREVLLSMHRKHYEELGFPPPDLRLVLTISEDSLKKRFDRGANGDPFDEMALEMVRVYGAEALDIARGRGFFAGAEIIDANFPLEVVVDRCLRSIERRLGLEEDVEGKRIRVEY